MDETDAIDPFAYQPLKVAKRKLASPTGATAAKKRRSSGPAPNPQTAPKSQRTPTSRGPARSQRTPRSQGPNKYQGLLESQGVLAPASQARPGLATPRAQGPGIQQLFAGTRSSPRPRAAPLACPLCQLPLTLLRSAAISRVHLEDCQEQLSVSGEEALRRPCPEHTGCRSTEVAHYSKFDHQELARHRDLGFAAQDEAEAEEQEAADPSLYLEASRQSLQLHLSASQPQRAAGAADQSLGPLGPLGHLDSLGHLGHPIDPLDPPAASLSRIWQPSPTKLPQSPRHVSPTPSSYRSPVQVQRRAVVCTSCSLPLASSVERRDHRCSPVERILERVEERPPSSLSVSLLAAAKEQARAAATPAATRPVLSSTRLLFAPPDEGGVIEGVSEVAGPSRANEKVTGEREEVKEVEDVEEVEQEGEVEGEVERSTNSEDDVINVVAEKDSNELELFLDIDPSVHCTRLRVRVPLHQDHQGNSIPLTVSANYTSLARRQASITDYFRGPGSREDSDSLTESAFAAVLQRARRKGFVAPDLRLVEAEPRRRGRGGEVRRCPWYKVMPDTTLAVDAFNYGAVPRVTHYLLSHFHYDHYVGLGRHWLKPIICSTVTKRLAVSRFKLPERLFITMDVGEEAVVAGVHLTALDANHCPGSLMFVLRLPTGLTTLHTGDFRASPEMEELPVLWNSRVDRVYLDTTYCSPQYDLPAQGDVVARTVELAAEFVTRWPGAVVMVGAYTVGKERLVKAVAEEVDGRLWTPAARREVWRCLGDRGLLDRLVEARAEARVQVIDTKLVSWGGLAHQLDRAGGMFDRVLGIRPTGWTHGKGEGREASLAGLAIQTRGQVSLLEVPYSEHSSYSELRRFVKFLRVKEASQVVATVNRRQAKEMEGMVRGWIEERRREGPDSQPLAGQGKAQVLVQGKVQGKVQVQKRQSGERMEAPEVQEREQRGRQDTTSPSASRLQNSCSVA